MANCTGCHSGNGAGLRRGKLDLTTFANLQKGTPDHGVIVPGKPEESHLVLRINGEEDPKMPQGNNRALFAEAITKITRWVKEGAQLDAGLDPAKPMESYAATPEDLRRMQLAQMPEKERDRKVIEAGQVRWKQSGAKEEAKVATAAHFIAFHDLPAGRAEGTLKTMEAQYNQMKRLLGPSRMDWPEKASLYIFNDNARYVEFVRTAEGREVDPDAPMLSVRFDVPEPYIAAVDPNGGRKEEPVRRRGRGRRTEAAESGAERSLAGVLTEGLGSGALAAAGKAPRWLREGVGTFLASGVEPRSPFYRRLRQAAAQDFAQSWPTRVTQALGDQLPADDLRTMGFALVECLMRSENSRGFPVLVEDLLKEGQGATDDAIRRAFGAEPGGVHPVHRPLGRHALRAGPMNDRTPPEAAALTSLPDPEGYFHPAGSGSRHEIFPGVEIRTTAGRGLMLSVVHLEPGSEVLEHSHPHEQMGMLVEGRLEFTIGGVTRLLGPGDIWRTGGRVAQRPRPSTARRWPSISSTRSGKIISDSVRFPDSQAI